MDLIQTILIYTAAIVSFITAVGYVILSLEKKEYEKYSSVEWRTTKWERALRILKYVSFFLIVLVLLSFIEYGDYS